VAALAVPGYGGVAGNPPGAPNALLSWARAVDGASSRLELHVNPHAGGAFRTIALPPAAPREVAVTLRPYEIDWSVDGGTEIVDEFPAARGGQAFNVYVYANAPQWQAPVSMALQEISVTRHRDAVPAQAAATVGRTVLFQGRADPAWEPVGVAGGDFARFGRYAGNALVIDVPRGSSWGKTGVMLSKPALHVERETDLAPYRFIIRTDPARTTGFVVALSAAHAPDMWTAGHLAWVSLIRGAAGTYELGLHQSPYANWSRPVTGTWNGQLTMTVAVDGVTTSVPGGPTIRAPLPELRENADYYLQVIAHPRNANEPASLALQSVTRDRVLPSGLPATRRWDFLSPEEFKPDAFMRDLQGDLTVAALPGRSIGKGGGK
jgi:hypothetical protein